MNHPRWIENLLKRFLEPALVESVLGDLQEKFNNRIHRGNPTPLAKALYALEAVGFLRLIKKDKLTTPTNPIYMQKHYLKVIIRNLRNNKLTGVINIAGLTLGITSSILIGLWVFHESSYDNSHANADKLHQVWRNVSVDGVIRSNKAMPLPLYDELKHTHSGIKQVAISNWGGEVILSANNKVFSRQGIFVSPEFLNMFSFRSLTGSASKALSDPSSIVITASLAKTLFGQEDAIGKTIRVGNESNFTVQAVIEDIPENSSFHYDCFLPFRVWEQAPWVQRAKNNWNFSAFMVYVELNSSDQETIVEQSIKNLLDSKMQNSNKSELFLHPLQHWHLYSVFKNGKEAGGIIEFVRLFSAIAIVILVMASINYINLATAQSERKAKETGIRKSIGSGRFQLIHRFMTESFVTVLIAFILAFLLVELSLPYYNQLLEKNLSVHYQSPLFWTAASLFVVVMSFLAGVYPAFYLSSFNPVRGLRAQAIGGTNRFSFKKALVVFQCCCSIFLIVATFALYQQIQLGKGRYIGYNKENLVTIAYTNEIDGSYDIIKKELLASGVVESVTKSNSAVTDIQGSDLLGWNGKDPDQQVSFTTIATGYDYTKTLGAKMIFGRDFSEDFPSDTSAIIVNKSGLDIMGLKDPVGEQLEINGRSYTLIGVVENILMGSPYQEIQPMYMTLNPNWIGAVTVRLRSNDMSGNLKIVERIVQKYNSANPFDFQFVDIEFERKFTSIKLISRLSNLFCALAIFISGLGLIGLAAFTAEKRSKEIGLRKVMGASVADIIILVSADFSRLVCFAFVFSTPIAWYLLTNFLARYPIRISIPLWVYPSAAMSILLLTLLISGIQTFKTATTNPVKSLKSNE